MKKALIFLFVVTFINAPSFAFDFSFYDYFNPGKSEIRAVKKVLNSQVKFANRMNFEKFISTFDPKYVNADGFDLEVYSTLIKDIWESYPLKYNIDIKDVVISGDKAIVKLIETSYADISMSKLYDGELKSEATTIYHLEKNKQGKWKVVSDEVVEETTSMLYGDAKDLDLKLVAPSEISANTDYTATLEFIPPRDTIAIASIASDVVQYPQPQTKEVFRALPEDNILERIFTSNSEDKNEYVVASIGLTKSSVEDLTLRLNLTGFGYKIVRVNVINDLKGDNKLDE